MATATKPPRKIKPKPKRKRQVKAVHIGPTKIPPLTLGWQILGWTAEYLQQPDGPNAGDAWVFTDEQALFLLNWYAVDRTGRFVYRSGMYRRMKGHGKDPFGAALCCVEFVGPCRFGGWRDGQPVAIPHNAAWVQTAAVSRDQTRNTMTLFPGMISQKAIAEYQIDLGKEIIYADRGRKRIEAVTSSPRALEGGRGTFVLKNESHHWLRSNDGHEMSKVIARNAAKSRDGASRVLAISNAHEPGEDSDAEHDYDAYQTIAQGLSRATGFLYDSLEAPPGLDLENDDDVRAGIIAARGDSEWVDVERMLGEIRDPRTTPAMARRFYFNQLEAEEDKPFDIKRLESLTDKEYRPELGAFITLGFDGSVKRDHTALVATEISTGYQWLYGWWAPSVEMPDGELWIPAAAVDETVDDAFTRYTVWRMYADPPWWWDLIAKWEGKYGEKVVKFSTNSYRRMAQALASYKAAIDSGTLSHDGNSVFLGAFANAHKQKHGFRDDKDEPMWTIQKERPDSPMKIDPAVAGALSWQARADAIAEGATPDKGFEPYVLV